MLHLGPSTRLSRVLALGFFVYIILELGPTASHVLCVRCSLTDRIALSLIACIAPDLAFLAVQQVSKHGALGVHLGGLGGRQTHAARLAAWRGAQGVGR